MAESTHGFAPRDAVVATRLVVVLTATASVLSIVFALALPSTGVSRGPLAVTIACPAAVLAMALVIAVRRHPPGWVWLGYPAAAVAAIVVTDLSSSDASVTGQLFFFFPVLFVASQLYRRPALALSAVAVLGEATVAATQLPVRMAVLQGAYVSAALLTTAGVLIYSGERIDRLVARLHEQAAIDPLTGLVTRRMLDVAVSTSLRSAADDGGTALLLVDLDRFKTINDEHGHLAGDLVLKAVADSLKGSSRSGDVVSRMGGDELAVLLPACSLPAATRWAQRVLEEIRSLDVDVSAVTMSPGAQPTRLRVTTSMGIAHLPTHSADVLGLYKAADHSLYEAKRNGRDRIGIPVCDTGQNAQNGLAADAA